MIKDFFTQALSLGASYNVDPLVFAIIYVAGIPIFFAVSAWMAYRYKNNKSITLQVILLVYLLIQPYLYVVIFGEGVPFWVYTVIVLLVTAGGYSLYKKVYALHA